MGQGYWGGADVPEDGGGTPIKMTTWDEFDSVGLRYDAEKDGVWVLDDKGEDRIFLGRRIIIKLLSELVGKN